jgi:hypothetical protein
MTINTNTTYKKKLLKSEGMQRDPMSNMHRLSYGVVKVYAKQDVDLTLKLWNLFNKKLDKTLYIKVKTIKCILVEIYLN